MISQEELYQLLSAGNYQKVIEFLHENKGQVNTDPMLKSAAETSITELVRASHVKENLNMNFLEQLEKLYLIKAGNFLELNNDQYQDLVASIIRISIDLEKKDKAYQYAKLLPETEGNKAIIDFYEKDQPKEVEHGQSQYIKLTHNKTEESGDSKISLFKSIEEQKMFLAFKRIFDTYQVYPNVGLSNLIAFEKIEKSLSSRERTYFFQATVDLVVFEPFNFYEPIYFFELDSLWHDEDNVIRKDKMKDNIFSLAGLRLYRIRDRQNQKIDEEEFLDLVREVRSLIDNQN